MSMFVKNPGFDMPHAKALTPIDCVIIGPKAWPVGDAEALRDTLMGFELHAVIYRTDDPTRQQEIIDALERTEVLCLAIDGSTEREEELLRLARELGIERVALFCLNEKCVDQLPHQKMVPGQIRLIVVPNHTASSKVRPAPGMAKTVTNDIRASSSRIIRELFGSMVQMR